MEPRTILVYVGLDRVGDSLLKLPFVRSLREAYPSAKITWLAGKGTTVYAGIMAPVVSGLIDEVIDEFDLGLNIKDLFFSPLGGRRFDLVIDTQKVALATLALYRVKHTMFISSFGSFVLSTNKPAKNYVIPKSMQRQLLDLLEISTGNKLESPKKLLLDIEPALLDIAERVLPDGQTYVGLLPGSGGKPKCWPLERYISIAKMQELKNRTPVFILGPEEIGWEREIKAAVPGAVFPLQKEGLGQKYGYLPQLTIAISQRLSVSVSNDSGGGHMCAVGGRPLVSLFGRTVPEKFMPMTQTLTVIKAQDYGGREMDFIPTEAVSSAIEEWLI